MISLQWGTVPYRWYSDSSHTFSTQIFAPTFFILMAIGNLCTNLCFCEIVFHVHFVEIFLQLNINQLFSAMKYSSSMQLSHPVYNEDYVIWVLNGSMARQLVLVFSISTKGSGITFSRKGQMNTSVGHCKFAKHGSWDRRAYISCGKDVFGDWLRQSISRDMLDLFGNCQGCFWALP